LPEQQGIILSTRFLLASSALAAIFATPAAAEHVISTAITTPVTTSSYNDSIRISSTGSVKPTGGAAVTIDTSNSVKNEGAIQITGANGSTGILANTNLSGNITNTGTITLDENYTATDSDSDGDIDGPFAQGNNRYGIHVLGGGIYTGIISNSGTITVEGNQSAGIAIDSTLYGVLSQTGTISVLGDDSVGIRIAGSSSDVVIGTGSSTTVQGKNAVGVLIGGDIGSLTVNGIVGTTGYRSTTPPADTSKLDSDDLLQGGSAVIVGGNVTNGVLFDSAAAITTYAAAPAIVIGSASQDITLGAVPTTSSGLIIKGTVQGLGTYSGVSATGVSVGGLGHAVNVTGGMTVLGSISAKSSGASATGIHIGAGATVPQIAVGGTVAASGGDTDASAAQAILIDAGAVVNVISNGGQIVATRTGTSGTAAAIVDNSGTLALVQNSGAIGVTNAADIGDAATAIDLHVNTTGAIVRQVAAATGRPAPIIAGSILFGTGNDTLDIQAGSVTGKVDFGGGSDVLSLSGTSLYRGTLFNSGGVAATVGTGSILDVQNLGAVNFASLTTQSGASLGVTIADSGHTLYNVAGAASFGTGTKILVTLDHVGSAAGTYTIIDAGTLTGAENLSSSVVTLPFLFNSTLTPNAATGEVALNVELKDSGELGLNTAETTVLDAALEVADADSGIAKVFLQTADSASLKSTLQQLMPDYAGGVFEAATKGMRLSAQMLSDPRRVPGLWLQEVTWGSSKSIGDTSSYDVSGWGFSGGYEHSLGPVGNVGVTVSYLWGKDGKNANQLTSTHYDGGVYWRGGKGPLQAWARATAGSIDFGNTRNFTGTTTTGTITRMATAKWNGRLYSASGGVSYEARMGRISIRPNASVEYYKLTEKGYTETGGGAAFDLTVRDRASNETAANAMLSVGYDVLGVDADSSWMRVELEGGRREILSGALGSTVASFGDSDPFTLTPEQRESGWRGAVRLVGGGPAVNIGAEASAEQLQGKTSLGGRLAVGMAF
jgi:hypothetical protein